MNANWVLGSLFVFYGLGLASALLAGRASRWGGHVFPLIACALGVALGLSALLGPWTWSASVPSTYPLLSFSFRLDALAAFFLVALGTLGAAVSWFAPGYVQHLGQQGHNVKPLIAFYNVFLASMTLVVLADQALLFLIAWELMALSSYFMVVFEHDRPQSRQAGFVYFLLTHVGTALVIVLFLSLYAATGSLDFEAWRTHTLLGAGLKDVLFLVAVLGFGLKAGIIPLHVWLPAAHPAAPSHVSALMSGLMIKLGIYGLLRAVFEWLSPFPSWWGSLILAIGAISAVLGVLYALMEHDLKRLLAYHSVENVGIILLGVGMGMSFQALGMGTLAAFALMAGLFHLLNHALFKGLLFLGAGAMLQATGTRNLEEMGGLLKRMPQTGLLFLVGSMAIVALPPFNGFASEWMTFQALLLSLGAPDTALRLSAPVAGAMLALTGALAVACFVKAFGIAFLGRARSEQANRARECGRGMRGGMAALAVLCLLLGLWPGAALNGLSPVVQAWTGQTILPQLSSSVGQVTLLQPGTPTSLFPLGILILFALLGAGVYLALKTIKKRGGDSVGASWDCGLRSLTPRMQYSATGFSKPIRMIFRMIYHPSSEVEVEPGVPPYFEGQIRYEVHIASPFETYFYQPAALCVLWLARQVRRLQTGSLQHYLLYVLVALLVVLWWAR